MRLDEILLVLTIIFSIVIAVFSARKFGAKPHKMLTSMVAANTVLDLVAIAIGEHFPLPNGAFIDWGSQLLVQRQA